MSTEKKSWVKDLLVAFAATTLSIILTFGTTAVVNRVKQKQERKLTALMVMGSIEAFARDLEQLEEFTAQHDSVATWLLNLPIEDVARLGDEPLIDTFNDVLELGVLNHDRTAETIFSSHIDTWKNMGNWAHQHNPVKEGMDSHLTAAPGSPFCAQQRGSRCAAPDFSHPCTERRNPEFADQSDVPPRTLEG